VSYLIIELNRPVIYRKSPQSSQSQPITYIIHTVEPEHFTVAHSLQSADPDSAFSISIQKSLYLGALFLIDLGWRRRVI
jgi:hypothetical protein